ncbi:MAG TPA: hypothetical protein PK239_01620 [Chitinophagales bacterium]|nr:hypothetical protein [Chitinophagales bacterium]
MQTLRKRHATQKLHPPLFGTSSASIETLLPPRPLIGKRLKMNPK